MKRIIAIGDLHCGHLAGLTPPRWQVRTPAKFSTLQRECWRFYADNLAGSKPDLLICNGDAITGLE